MQTFAELLTSYMERTGIRDAELARRIPVSRQTLVRWKEGVTSRPRYREDVIRCAELLRLTVEETDGLLLAAGFSPETAVPASDVEDRAVASTEESPETPSLPEARVPARKGRRSLLIAGAGLAVLIAIVAVGLFLRYWDTAEYPAAVDGESLIVLSPFVNYTGGGQGFNVVGRLRSAVDDELGTAGLTSVRTVEWPREIDEAPEAEEAIRRSNAAILIWGEYDSGRVVARFTAPDDLSSSLGDHVVDISSSPSDLPATINIGLTNEVRFVALATLGQLYLERDEFDRAKTLLISALDPPPAEVGALANLRFLLGSAFLGGDLADYDEAIWLFTQVLAVEPRSVEALNSRALAYLGRDRVGDPGLAIDDLNRAATIRPDRAGTHLNLAVAYIERGEAGDLDLAIESLDEAISIKADYTSAFVNRAAAYIARGEADDLDRALEDIETALEIEPGLSAAYLNRGNAYVARGSDDDLQIALVEFTKALRLDPFSTQALFNRALVYSELGDLDRSLADLRRAQEVSPKEVVYNRTLCRQMAVTGNAEEGRDFCKLALEYDPEGLSRDVMGLANALSGRVPLAIADFESFVEWIDESSKPTCSSQYRETRISWLNALRAGEDPFDEATLYDLRARPAPPGKAPC